MSDELVTISGDFLPDGRCNAHSPRGDIAPPPATGRTTYRFGGIFNVAPSDFVVHVFACSSTQTDSVLPSQARSVTFTMAVPSNSAVPAGRYRIEQGGLGDTIIKTASASFKHPAFGIGTPGAGGGGAGGIVYLQAVGGTLELTRIDPPGVPERGYTAVPTPRIEGRFVIQARRAWSMN